MAFWTSWMVKGRFSSCLLWAWLKTRGRRSILACGSGSSLSLVGVCCRGKLSWVAWSTVAGSSVREPFSCRTVVMVRWPVSVMASLRVEGDRVGEFMLRILFVFPGDALLPVDVPPLQVCPDVGYLRPAVVYLAAGLGGVGVEEGRQLLLCMPEVTEHVP